EYVDNGWSGETLARPALDQLRDDAKQDIFEAVHVHSVDRFLVALLIETQLFFAALASLWRHEHRSPFFS
ncbi:unnamed protein product, partial [marine sediment metagenome]